MRVPSWVPSTLRFWLSFLLMYLWEGKRGSKSCHSLTWETCMELLPGLVLTFAGIWRVCRRMDDFCCLCMYVYLSPPLCLSNYKFWQEGKGAGEGDVGITHWIVRCWGSGTQETNVCTVHCSQARHVASGQDRLAFGHASKVRGKDYFRKERGNGEEKHLEQITEAWNCWADRWVKWIKGLKQSPG